MGNAASQRAELVRTAYSGMQWPVLRATDLGILPNPRVISGRDGGYSGVFAGRSVWPYGDTSFQRTSGEGHMASNTWAFSDDVDASDGIRFTFPVDQAGDPALFLTYTPAEHDYNVAHAGERCRAEPCQARWALWPLTIVPDPARARALIFYTKMHALPGEFNFRCEGRGIALWSHFDAARARPPQNGFGGEAELMFRGNEPNFGSAAVVEGEMLYVYGCDTLQGKKLCRLGRVPLVQALDRRAWQYFVNGANWTNDLGAASVVMEGNDVLSVAYNRHLRAYVAIYAKPLANQVLLTTAPRPEGPWTQPVVAFDTLKPEQLWVYDALAHPELERENGRIQYVSYSRRSGAGSEMRLVEMELAR